MQMPKAVTWDLWGRGFLATVRGRGMMSKRSRYPWVQGECEADRAFLSIPLQHTWSGGSRILGAMRAKRTCSITTELRVRGASDPKKDRDYWLCQVRKGMLELCLKVELEICWEEQRRGPAGEQARDMQRWLWVLPGGRGECAVRQAGRRGWWRALNSTTLVRGQQKPTEVDQRTKTWPRKGSKGEEGWEDQGTVISTLSPHLSENSTKHGPSHAINPLLPTLREGVG